MAIINAEVRAALSACLSSPDGVIEAALTVFNPETQSNKASVVEQLTLAVVTPEDPHIQKISFEEKSPFFPVSSLDSSHVAAVILLDLVRAGWLQSLPSAEIEAVSAQYLKLQALVKQLAEADLEDYGLRNLQVS